MYSKVSRGALLPEIETVEAKMPQIVDQKPVARCHGQDEFARIRTFARSVRASIKTATYFIQRFLTTFAVLEIIGVLGLLVCLQL